MQKAKRLFLIHILFTLIFTSSLLMIGLDSPKLDGDNRSATNEKFPLKVSETDPTIYIDGNDGLDSSTYPGSGTYNDPYRIENKTIEASSAHGIHIKDTDLYLTIRNCTIENGTAGASSDYDGIYLKNCGNVTIINNTCLNNDNGISLSESNNNTLLDNLFGKNYIGISLSDSINNTFSNNNMSFCGFKFDYSTEYHNEIDTTNKVNGKSVHYYEDENNLEISGIDLGQIILINCNDSVIENLEIMNTSIGIYLWQSENNTLTKNNCSYNTLAGIDIRYANNNTVSNNNCWNNSDGIYFKDSENNTISSNNCSKNNDAGIQLKLADNNTLSDNYCWNNSDGIYFWESENNTITENNCSNNNWGIFFGYYNKNNTISENNCSNNIRGMHFETGSDNNTVSDNFCSFNDYGIDLVECEDNTFLNNMLESCGFTISHAADTHNEIDTTNKVNGKSVHYYEDENELEISGTDVGQVILMNCNDSIIYNSEILDTSIGIYLRESENNTISDNNCSSNIFSGIHLDYSENNTVLNNNCSKNGRRGIYLENSNNNTISSNNCSYNSYDAIWLRNSNKTIVLDNRCSNNSDGIDLRLSNNNTILNNTCFNNAFQGIYMDASDNNTIWNNIFQNNNYYEAFSTGSEYNTWDNGTIGNYWGDYVERYPDADNIGYVWQTPYKINGTTATYDNYPLVIDTPPSWDEFPTDQIINVGDPFTYDVNASDVLGIDQYWINDTTDFQIDRDGKISNATVLSMGYYDLEINVNDTNGNIISAIVQIWVKETTKPTWDQTPTDQVVNIGDPFTYDVNASDNVGIDHYWINDTTRFQIDNNGIITNNTFLAYGTYGLEIKAIDTSGNEISAIIQITVKETIKPYWDQTPTDQVLEFGQSLFYNLNASDNVGIDHYWINDTSRFQIDNNGIITNITTLSLGTYGLKIKAVDTSGNEVSAIIDIIVQEKDQDSDDPDDDNGEDPNNGIPSYNPILLGTIGLITTFLIIRKIRKTKSK
ncbi:MAG: hypothetical protein BAJALOKI2v1_130051 [Promethearchaeota archaeon]|nr:MAG: hypothetical protein BAJALOKI2v1_130051 [Candidatus Lokiarchaeota archaeon]